MHPISRRHALAGLSSLTLCGTRRARAATPVRFLTSWFAQAEQGGYYQAQATGLYAREGLDVTVGPGGPQINGMQLLLAGEADIIVSYDIQVLKAVERQMPVVAIAAPFQADLQGLMTHADIDGLAALKGHPIFISSVARTTFWPWLQQRFGFTDGQAAPYTFNLQPFLHDPAAAVQAYSTSEPFEARRLGAQIRFFPFSDAGYPPYGNPIVTTRRFADANPDIIRGFLRASMLGWRDYLRDPAPADAVIRQQNARMSDGQLAFAVDRLKTLDLLGRGDAATMGIGTITEARWKRTFDFLVTSKLISPSTDWRQAFTTRFVSGLDILPA